MQIQHSHALLIYPLPKLSMTVCIMEFKNKAQAVDPQSQLPTIVQGWERMP